MSSATTMKKLIEKILFWIARSIIVQRHPQVIAITGSVGKTSAKDAIATVLKTKYTVRSTPYNFNNELGVPLTIIGSTVAPGKNVFIWLQIICKGIISALLPVRYPEILVLEMGADKPGDIKYLTKLAPAQVGIVTAITDAPAHLAAYKDIEHLIKEKQIMYRHMKKQSWAIVNLDEGSSRAVAPQLHCQTMSIAIDHDADLRALDVQYSTDPAATTASLAGLRFKLQYQGGFVPIFIPGVVGLPSVYAALFAAAVGSIYGMNLVDISAAVQQYIPSPGRLRLLAGIHQSTLIDDTYNASPAAMRTALRILEELKTPGRRIACLGEMAELGSQTKRSHQAIGKLIAQLEIDSLVTIGEAGEWIAEGAIAGGMFPDNMQHYPDAITAAQALPSQLQPNDMLLVKGSQVTRLEGVVKACLEDPSQAKHLLVRQYGHWIK